MEGFFRFGTSYRLDFEKLCKRLGGIENIMEVKESKNSDGKTVFWECKVSTKYRSFGNFGVKKLQPMRRGRPSNFSSIRAG